MATIHRITTDDSLTQDLRDSLNLHGVPVGSGTLAEIFGACLSLGILPDERVDMIEFGCARDGKRKLTAERNEHGNWEVRERV